ncbi:substrate-binding domain-containing protein [Oscillospiraceae bacterium MB08-C2-2]|nr:substrate-binding domain-containing protein [Oscillospiraceae bacterium MB08-C2-2]
MKRKSISIVLAAVLVLMALAGCGSSTPATSQAAPASSTAPSAASSAAPESAADKKITVGFIVGSREHVFYNLIEAAIVEESKKLGIEAIVYDGELDANVQSNHIDNLVAMKVDAIALATVDAAGVGPAIDAASASGIPCFTFDSGYDSDSIICHAGTDNVEGGRLGAQEALRLAPKGSSVAMIGNPASASVLDRQKGFEEVIKAQTDVEYPFFGNYEGDANVAMSLTQDWLVSKPDLAVIFCAGDPAATGALSAIKAAGAKTLVVGFDGNPEAIAAIKDKEGDGQWWVSEISQNPALIGTTITQQVHKYLTSGSVDAKLIPIDPYIITAEYIEKNGL